MLPQPGTMSNQKLGAMEDEDLRRPAPDLQ
jgi:hypothetical protein